EQPWRSRFRGRRSTPRCRPTHRCPCRRVATSTRSRARRRLPAAGSTNSRWPPISRTSIIARLARRCRTRPRPGGPPIGEPQSHVVPDGAADQLCRRDHIQAVKQTEPAQKPFGQNGIRLRGTEELIEQIANRLVPPLGLAGGVVQRYV